MLGLTRRAGGLHASFPFLLAVLRQIVLLKELLNQWDLMTNPQSLQDTHIRVSRTSCEMNIKYRVRSISHQV
jgi:hypothetical protein